MKSCATIWEIFNKCPNNQMRDVFIDEVEAGGYRCLHPAEIPG